MSEQIDFYTSPMSRGRMVHWMFEEVGASYRPHLLDLQKNEQKKPEYLAINPMGKVPAIVHRGVVITEVAAICTYLADAFPAAKLAPSLTDPQRGAYLRWMFFAAACLDNALVDRMLSRPAPTERLGALGYGNYDDVMKTVEQALSRGPYLLGEQFTAADLYLASQIGFGLMTKTLEPRPVFQTYLARTSDRPANQRFQKQNEQWIAEQKSRA
jgi:glutathione S-transferase